MSFEISFRKQWYEWIVFTFVSTTVNWEGVDSSKDASPKMFELLYNSLSSVGTTLIYVVENLHKRTFRKIENWKFLRHLR